MNYSHIAGRIYGTPLWMHPAKAAVVESVFRHRALELRAPKEQQQAAACAAASAKARELRSMASRVRFREGGNRPYELTEAGVALIPVLGTLVHRTLGMEAMSGMTSYGALGALVRAAAEDAEARAILLEVDSPGGEAAGLGDLAETLLEARAKKPLWAAINEEAYSAAYFIAASATKVTIPVSGGTGSIGVIALHLDQSQRDAKRGEVYTYVYAGARKKDGNPHEPISSDARAGWQESVDRSYGLFVEHVARARGISEASVRATEAGMLSPQLAKAGRFVDKIATFAQTLDALEAWSRGQQSLRPASAAAPAARRAAYGVHADDQERFLRGHAVGLRKL